MYALPFTVVLAGLGVGLTYAVIGAGTYLLGHRRGARRLTTAGQTLITRSPAVIVAAAIAFGLLTVGVTPFVALGIAVIGALVPPIRAVGRALDESADSRT